MSQSAKLTVSAAAPFRERAAAFIVNARWLWLALALAIVGASMAKLDRIWPLDPDARVFFAPENPDRQALDRFEDTFAKDDSLSIVIEVEGGEVFTPEVLAAIGDLTDRAWLLPFVRRVDSLTNFQHSYADGDELIVRDLVPEPASVTAEEAAAVKATALGRIELVNFTIPGDKLASGRTDVTQVFIRFTLPGENPTTEVPSIVAAAQTLRADIEKTYPFLDLRLTGSVMINNQFSVSGQQDGQQLLGPMFVVILLIVGLALRSIFAMVATLIVIALSALAGLGALGWMGLPLNSVTKKEVNQGP